MASTYNEDSLSQREAARLYTAKHLIRAIQQIIDNSPHLKIADFGCGPGESTQIILAQLIEQLQNSDQAPDKITVIPLDHSEPDLDQCVRLLQRLCNKTKIDLHVLGALASFSVPGIIEQTQGDVHEVLEEGLDAAWSNEAMHWTNIHEIAPQLSLPYIPHRAEQIHLQALENWYTKFANVKEVLRPGGIAVLQFGHQGQLGKLWECIEGILQHPEFEAFKTNFAVPLHYPPIQDIQNLLTDLGFQDISITTVIRDLDEPDSTAIIGFVKGFLDNTLTESGMDQATKENFYQKLQSAIEEYGVDEFRKDQWHNTIVQVTN